MRLIDADDLKVEQSSVYSDQHGNLVVGLNTVKQMIERASTVKMNTCNVCENLEKGDTLYISSDWDGGIGFDYIRDIQFCPVCGRRLTRQI